jgi:predicted small metal-binding protein
MKTMTCMDMGGPCEHTMTAETSEEMIKMGGDHVMSSMDDKVGPNTNIRV